MVNGTQTVLHIEAGTVLIGITEVVPVFPAEITERDTVGVMIPTGSKAVQRVNVAQVVAAADQLDTDLHTRNAHVGERIVHTFDQKTDGVNRAASDDVDIENIGIGRAGIGTVLDMQTDLGMLDRDILHAGFASAVDGHTVCDVIAVDDTARQIIVAAVGVDGIERFCRTETDERFFTVPALHCFDDREVGQLQRYRMIGIRRRCDRLGQQIFAVREEDDSLRVVKNQLLQGIRNVLTGICLDVVGDNNVHVFVKFVFHGKLSSRLWDLSLFEMIIPRIEVGVNRILRISYDLSRQYRFTISDASHGNAPSITAASICERYSSAYGRNTPI